MGERERAREREEPVGKEDEKEKSIGVSVLW